MPVSQVALAIGKFGTSRIDIFVSDSCLLGGGIEIAVDAAAGAKWHMQVYHAHGGK